MKITLLGGTGFVGRHLHARLQQQGHEVHAYGRDVFASTDRLTKAMNGTEVLINLTGENIGKRWSDAYKKALYDSRVGTNRQIQAALSECSEKPKKILSASAIGIYPENDCAHPLDEHCEQVGQGFLGQLGQAWEQSALALTPAPIIMRFGVVLGMDGGALQKMLPAFKFGLGGPVAGGQQCFTWIHIDDLTRAIQKLAESDGVEGVYNLCSPYPVTNEEFGRTLAKTLNRPFLLPLPKWQLKLMFGEGAQVLTHSSAIVPTRLQQLGFEFEFSTAEQALGNLLKS